MMRSIELENFLNAGLTVGQPDSMWERFASAIA
jgi:hypothetical protein